MAENDVEILDEIDEEDEEGIDSLCLLVDPTTIKVKENLPRVRKEMGKIKDLIGSFEKFGQMQPCVVNREMELIAGGRRLAACIETGRKVKIVFSDTIDPVKMREMELEENIQRKALTAAEEIMAVSELHQLKQTLYGETVQGKEGGWTMQQTAEAIGKTRNSVVGDLALAQALEDFPSLVNCKSKSDIKRAVKGLQRISDSVTALETYDKITTTKGQKFELHHADCEIFLPSMKDNSVDLLFTDPPYGIDVHESAIGIGGKTGSDITMSGFQYEDGFEDSMKLISTLAIESARIVKPTGFAVVFCAISHFWIVRSIFETAGWLCSQRPIIWIKNESGQNNAPSKWMSAGYESALFARKVDSNIVIEGKVDWVQCPNVPPSARIHQAEKPVPLVKELISRLVMPGAVVLDPFVGSGATIESCLDLKMYPIGCEKLVEAYATAKSRMGNYLKSKGV